MMLNAKGRPLISAVLILTLSGMTTSCIDNSYDLKKDIDATINVGGEYLAFPVGSTEQITLDKIIEIDEGDDLQLVDGEYRLLKEGTVDDAKTDVKKVTVKGRDNQINEITAANEHSALYDGVIETDIDEKGDIDADADNIDDAVKEIGSLKADKPTDLILKLTLKGNLNYESIQTELKVTFPDFLEFAPDNKLKNNVLTLTLDNGDLPLNRTYEYPLKLTGFHFSSEPGKGREVINNQLTIHDQVTITGKAFVTVDGDILAGTSLTIVPVVTLADMEVQSVTGIIQPTIDETGSNISLNNLPDFLKDDAVELDITNPIFTFIAENPLDAPIVLNGEMYGSKDGKKIEGSTVVIGENSTDKIPIILKPNSTTTISLSRLGSGGPEGAENIKVSDINNLIKKIPDVVDVKLQPAVTYDEYYTVELGKTYSMSSSYDIDIPLSFGSKLKIVYKDSINDLHSDLEDIDFKKAVIAINADNTIPLELEVKEGNVTAKDMSGAKIDAIKVTVDGTIKESKDGKEVAPSQLTITLEETQKGAISNLEELVFKVTAVPGQAINVQLRGDQWMQLKDMKLRVPNGIKIDLN